LKDFFFRKLFLGGQMIKNFRTYELAVEFYKQCKTLSLKGATKNQLERASLSIVLNLAEGWGKFGKKDKMRFFDIAMGSTRECQAIFTVEELTQIPAYETLDHIAASLFRLTKRAI
jgi:four helix bundle protein